MVKPGPVLHTWKCDI